MSDVVPDDLVETKGDFARRINVSAGRVSQYISSGQLGPDALDGEGRSARIRVKIALQHLGMRLDIGQRLGNGIATRLPLGGDGASSSSPVATTFEAQIQREKLEDMQRRNRLAARDEFAERGVFTASASVRRDMLKLAAEMLAVFEGGLPEIANAVASHFHIPQRDVLHLIRNTTRELRAQASLRARQKLEGLPKFEEVEPHEGGVRSAGLRDDVPEPSPVPAAVNAQPIRRPTQSRDVAGGYDDFSTSLGVDDLADVLHGTRRGNGLSDVREG